MTIKADIKLPYEFDLFYDIKTLAQLEKEYLEAVTKVDVLQELCKDYNITLKEVN